MMVVEYMIIGYAIGAISVIAFLAVCAWFAVGEMGDRRDTDPHPVTPPRGMAPRG